MKSFFSQVLTDGEQCREDESYDKSYKVCKDISTSGIKVKGEGPSESYRGEKWGLGVQLGEAVASAYVDSKEVDIGWGLSLAKISGDVWLPRFRIGNKFYDLNLGMTIRAGTGASIQFKGVNEKDDEYLKVKTKLIPIKAEISHKVEPKAELYEGSVGLRNYRPSFKLVITEIDKTQTEVPFPQTLSDRMIRLNENANNVLNEDGLMFINSVDHNNEPDKVSEVDKNTQNKPNDLQQKTKKNNQQKSNPFVAECQDEDKDKEIGDKEEKSSQDKTKTQNENIKNKDNEEASSKEKFTHDLHVAQSAFAELAGLGAMLSSEELYKTGVIGQNLVKISESLTALNMAFPLLGEAMSFVASTQPYLAGIAAAVQIGQILFGKPKEDKNAQLNIKYMQAILESLSVIRTEMHQGFQNTNHNIKQLGAQLDQVYYSLKDVIQANHDLELRNIGYTGQTLGEDILQLGKILESLLRNTHIDELDKLLISIGEHRNGRIVGDKQDKLASILKANSELTGVWLLKNLIGPNYNGNVYSSDSTRQDEHYTRGGVLPEAALGYLHKYASDNLGFSAELVEIDPRKLPLVDVWTHAIQASITAQIIAAQQYDHELPMNTGHALLEIVDNSINMIEALGKHASKLFLTLNEKHKSAQNDLLKNFKIHLKEKLKNNERYYSLKHAIANNWINLAALTHLIDGTFQSRIVSQTQAQELKLPLIFMLAQNAGLISLTPNNDYKRHNAAAGWNSDAGCPQHKSAFKEASLGMNYGFTVSLPQDNTIFSVHSSIPQVHTPQICYRNRDYPSAESAAITRASDANKESDKALIARSNIQSVNVNTNLRAVMNDLYLDKMIDKILNAKISGDVLSAEVETIYSEAITEFLLDSASNSQSIDMLVTNKQLMLAYAELLGLPINVQATIITKLECDAKKLLTNPAQIANVKEYLDQITNDVSASLPNRSSRISQKLQAIKNSVKSFGDLAKRYHNYKKRLSAWMSDVQSVNRISQQLKHMRKICDESQFPMCDSDNLQSVSLQLNNLLSSLNELHQDLVKQHAQLTSSGFNIPKPSSIDDINLCTPQTEVSTPDTNPYIDESELEYSPTKVAALIEEDFAKMAAIPRFEKPGHLRQGTAGRGKSSLTSFSEGGTDYTHHIDDAGETIVLPIGEEIAKTGAGQSTTTFPGFYVRENTCYVDFPGNKDTRDKDHDVSNAFLIPCAAAKFDHLSVIETIMTSADIYDSRYLEVVDVLMRTARIIADNPEKLMPHILITITKPAVLRLEKNGPEQYEKEILIYLKKWLKQEQQAWFKPGSETALRHEHYALAMFISGLEASNIIVVDVTNPDHRLRYHDRLRGFTQRTANEFNLKDFDKASQEFKRFIENLNQHSQSRLATITNYIAVLGNYWKKEADEISKNPLLDAWESFSLVHQSVIELANKLNKNLIAKPDLHHDIIGDIGQLSQAVIHYSNELVIITPMLERLNKIAKSLDSGSCQFDSDESTVKSQAKFEEVADKPLEKLEDQLHDDALCEGSAWPFTGACGAPVPALTFGQPEYALIGAEPIKDGVKDKVGDTAIPTYQCTLDANITLLQVVIHWASRWLPWNQARPKTEVEIDELRAMCDGIRMHAKHHRHLARGPISRYELADKLSEVQSSLRKLDNDLSEVMAEPSITDTQLSEVNAKFERIGESLTHLDGVEKQLIDFEKESKKLSLEGKKLIVCYHRFGSLFIAPGTFTTRIEEMSSISDAFSTAGLPIHMSQKLCEMGLFRKAQSSTPPARRNIDDIRKSAAELNLGRKMDNYMRRWQDDGIFDGQKDISARTDEELAAMIRP